MSQSTTLFSALTAAQLAAMNAEQIVKMGRELLAQLVSCPEEFHGNIWLGSIHFDADGKAVLCSRSDAPVSERSPEQIEFMAPEAFWENRFGRSADLYSIAMVMYTAYNGGCLPFTASQEPTDVERAQALRTRMKGAQITPPASASEAVQTILSRALSYDPSQRYLTAEAMLHDLSETDEALPSEAPDDEQAADPEAAAAAAATGMAGVSVVAELAAIPKESVRPVEAAAGVSASSILLEKELRDMDKPAPKTAPRETEPLRDIFSAPETPAVDAAEPEVPVPNAPEQDTAAPTEVLTAEGGAVPPSAAEAATEVLPPKTEKKPQPKPEKKPQPVAQMGGKKKKNKATPKPESGMAELSAAPVKTEKQPEETKPLEAAIEVKPERKAMEQKPEKKPEPTAKSVPAGGAKASRPETSVKTAPGKPAAKDAPKKQYTVQKEVDRRQEAAVRRKNRSGAAIAIGVGAVVIAGLIAVAAYSLGAFEKEEPMALVTAEPETPATAQPTEAPTPVPVLPDDRFTATAVGFDWDELKNVGLAVLEDENAFNAAVAAAEKAGLENAWLGARYLDAEDAPDGQAGWYWLDGTQLPENSAFWADGEPSASSGGRLMMRCAPDKSWRFYSVTREQFDKGGFDALGCITDGSGMAAIPSPTPKPTAEPTPEPTETPSSTTNSYIYSAPVSAATAAPTSAPESTTPTSAPTTAPTAAPTTTPAPTAAPEKYGVASKGESWANASAGGTLAVVSSAEDFAAVTAFLDAYNTAHADEPVKNVWLGAEYKEAEGERLAGWYWTNGTALAADDVNWAAGESAKTTGCKLMLRYVDESWKYYAVTDADFAADSTTYANTAALTPKA